MIAILGTGRMGTAFAKRLIDVGQSVVVWNRTQANTATAADAGATVSKDIATCAKAEIVLISLTDAAAVKAVTADLISAGIAGKLVVDMSTLLPEETETIAANLTAAGADFVDCPVGGTVGPALKGLLLGMAGGTDGAFEKAKPVLEKLCKRVEHLGPPGSGARMKLAVNLPLALYWKTLAEALSLLEGSGISTETAISLLADSSGGPTVLSNRAQVVIDTLNGADQLGTFDIEGLAKDLNLALKQADRLGHSMPLSETAWASYRKALDVGLGQFDGASLTKFLIKG